MTLVRFFEVREEGPHDFAVREWENQRGSWLTVATHGSRAVARREARRMADALASVIDAERAQKRAAS